MKKLLILMMAISLSACELFPVKPDQPVVVKYKYIVNTIPEEMLSIPTAVPDLDLSVATDKDAAKWMIDSESRYQTIEKKLEAVKTYQDDKIKNLSVPAEDVIMN
jgi:hypothetical protein